MKCLADFKSVNHVYEIIEYDEKCPFDVRIAYFNFSGSGDHSVHIWFALLGCHRWPELRLAKTKNTCCCSGSGATVSGGMSNASPVYRSNHSTTWIGLNDTVLKWNGNPWSEHKELFPSVIVALFCTFGTYSIVWYENGLQVLQSNFQPEILQTRMEIEVWEKYNRSYCFTNTLFYTNFHC